MFLCILAMVIYIYIAGFIFGEWEATGFSPSPHEFEDYVIMQVAIYIAMLWSARII